MLFCHFISLFDNTPTTAQVKETRALAATVALGESGLVKLRPAHPLAGDVWSPLFVPKLMGKLL